MATSTSANEESQLLQTIEMFEVITQSQPLDYQSLEILKEAYFKLGREKDVIGTSKRIAQSYVQLGQLSSAILEYESILQRFPDDPDVQAALAEIENKANSLSAPRAAETELVDKAQAGAARAKAVDGRAVPAGEIDDGQQTMLKHFVDAKVINPADFKLYWATPNLEEPPKQVMDPFIQVLADKQLLSLDKSLKLLCDKSHLSFIPIEKYEVDIELTRTFPREACQRWCILPFDRLSKSVLVATANPFNKQAARDLEAVTKNRLLWYVASPPELVKIIKKIFR